MLTAEIAYAGNVITYPADRERPFDLFCQYIDKI